MCHHRPTERLTAVECEAFCDIPSYELLGGGHGKPRYLNLAPATRLSIDRFNATTAWIEHTIVGAEPATPTDTDAAGGGDGITVSPSSLPSKERPTAAQCAQAIEYFCKVAAYCEALGNLQGQMEILFSVHGVACRRLKTAWSLVSPATIAAIEKMKITFSNHKRFKAYRQVLETSRQRARTGGPSVIVPLLHRPSSSSQTPPVTKVAPTTLPSLAFHLSDLTLIRDGNPSQLKLEELATGNVVGAKEAALKAKLSGRDEEIVNFSKLRLAAETAEDLARCQDHCLRFLLDYGKTFAEVAKEQRRLVANAAAAAANAAAKARQAQMQARIEVQAAETVLARAQCAVEEAKGRGEEAEEDAQLNLDAVIAVVTASKNRLAAINARADESKVDLRGLRSGPARGVDVVRTRALLLDAVDKHTVRSQRRQRDMKSHLIAAAVKLEEEHEKAEAGMNGIGDEAASEYGV